MAKKKKPSKIKKILKALGKGILLGGAAYGASKLFGGRRKGAVSTVGQPFGVSRAAYKPSHLGEGVARPYQDDIMRGGTGMTLDKTDRPWWKFKKGGRVTGIAKRGFGRALKKK